MKQTDFARKPFDPAKSPVFYGWVIILMGTLGILMSIPGQTMGVSTFTDYLIGALKINRDQISFAYMIGTIGSSLLLTKAGRLYDKKGVRPVAIGASFLLAATLVYLSQLDRIIQQFASDIATIPNLTIAFTIVGFFLLRFSGQGVLTLVSRTMMMKWFDKKRGFATGFSNVVISLFFSATPLIFELSINDYGWRATWLSMAFILAFIFPLIILIFFRNNPEDVGLKPDGKIPKIFGGEIQKKFVTVKTFTLSESLKTLPFWVFALALAMQGFYISGFTFHIVSIFDNAGLSRETAIGIFLPSSFVAIVVTLITSGISDYIKLKYLVIIKSIGAFFSILGFMYLDTGEIAYYSLILGNGILTGLYGVIATVTWPRFFGNKHLGEISGQAMMLMVFFSALGPIFFSRSLSMFGEYYWTGLLTLIIFMILTIAAFWADNPQDKYANNIV